MNTLKSLMTGAALLMATVVATPVLAQQSSYTEGTVWTTSRIKVLPGQFENYMDWLNTGWKAQQEFFKKEGWLISYHVLQVNSRRENEPDLILVQEWKDYATNAQQKAMQDKFMAQQKTDARAMTTASGQRQAMRVQMGGMELQELNLK
jgi:hypothetical protein